MHGTKVKGKSPWKVIFNMSLLCCVIGIGRKKLTHPFSVKSLNLEEGHRSSYGDDMDLAMKRLDVVPEELWTLLLANSMGPFDFGLWPLVAPKKSLWFLFSSSSSSLKRE